MAELFPIPLDLQLHRAFLEYEREGRIFHLPKEKFFTGLAGFDTSVTSNGQRASSPLGPAAGPHTQLMQNIVLSWLAGSRIIELKTVQVLDELKIARPCIDSANVTFNVEWSQELKLEQSLREYVSAVMFLQILKTSHLLGECYPGGCDDTIFDMSIGYNLAGIRAPRVRAWLEGMKNATGTIDELRSTLMGRFRQYRDLAFPTQISDTITLSTFHGCPPEEIEGIVTFLLSEMGLNVCIKMNPTLMGRGEIVHLLFDVLGYRDIELSDEAFERDLKFSEALDLLPRLETIAKAHNRQLSVKFSNTLVVRNNRKVFADALMYMSGPALHVLTLNLVKKFREHASSRYPISFSAGLNAQNMADMVAMDFVPVTTCTDLLKPGGYSRLHKYMDNLGMAMSSCRAKTITEFVIRYGQNGEQAVDELARSLRGFLRGPGEPHEAACRAAEKWIAQELIPGLKSWMQHPMQPLRAECERLVRRLHANSEISLDPRMTDFIAQAESMQSTLKREAGLLNTPTLVQRATEDRRYRRESNKASPRKTGSKLDLFDCITCDKCVAVCPNAAIFSFDTPGVAVPYSNYELRSDGSFAEIPGGALVLSKPRQFASYADACNDCGNCEAACPEGGGPNVAKPRFFSTFESFSRNAEGNGFLVEANGSTRVLHAVIAGERYTLRLDEKSDSARFETGTAEFIIRSSRDKLIRWNSKAECAAPPRHLDMLPYLQMKFLLGSVLDDRHINYVNTAQFQGVRA
jgi:putative selenate reductase